jgi:4'-phosphopantetheinyl transferase
MTTEPVYLHAASEVGPLESCGMIHVWHAMLDSAFAGRREYFEGLLSPDEHERAGRYHFEKDRNRFVAARAILRTLIEGYSGLDARRITFKYNRYGKPLLESDDGQDLVFNVSHSGERALYVFARGMPVGVDLERLRSNVDHSQIARRFFTADETSVLEKLPEEQRLDAFFNGWTRKEALIKAMGQGLAFGLNSFDVSLRPGEPPVLLRTRYDEDDVEHWAIGDIPVESGYKAAFAARGQDLNVLFYVFDPDQAGTVYP